MAYVSRGQSVDGLFTTEEEDRAGAMFGRGAGRPIIKNRVNTLLYTFNAPFPPPPFAVEIFGGDVAPGPNGDGNTVGLAWDSATKKAADARLIPEGTTATFRIDKVEGNRLELWTDGLVGGKGNEDNGLPWGFRTPVLRPLVSSVAPPAGSKPPPPAPSRLPSVPQPLTVPGVDDSAGLSMTTKIGLGVGVVAVLLLLGGTKD